MTTDKTIKSKNQPKQTNVTWIDLSGEIPIEKHYINGQWVAVSGGGGTKKYSDLEEKPLINGVELNGNKTSSDLGVATSQQGAKADTAYQKPQAGIPESDLSSDVQSQLNKHFKGWYASSSALLSNPVVGDYAYVKGAESTDPAAIYECTTAGSWSNSGRTADTSNVQTFASNQEVNEVHIVNDLATGGTNDVLSAEQGKELGEGLVQVESKVITLKPKTVESTNLLNPSTELMNMALNTAGPVEYDGTWISDFIPVKPSTTYSIRVIHSNASDEPNARYVYQYNSDKGYVTKGERKVQITTNSNVAYIRLQAVMYAGKDYTNDGVFEGATYEFEKYHDPYNYLEYDSNRSFNVKTEDEIVVKKDVEQVVSLVEQKKLTVEIAHPLLSVKNKRGDVINCTFLRSEGSNPCFNFVDFTYNQDYVSNTDDVAPAHIQNSTIGANHGIVAYIGKVTGHGLTNTSIGTAWRDTNEIYFYIMQILDSDNIVFLSENTGTAASIQRTALGVGTLSGTGGATLTVTETSQTQIFPSIRDVEQRIYCDGIEIDSDGTFSCDTLTIEERYGIMNPQSVLENIIARAGQSDDPVFLGDSMVNIKNTYIFSKSMTVTLICTAYAKMRTKFTDYMFSQAQLGFNSVQFYVPNSLPVNSTDFNTPQSLTFSSSIPSWNFTSEYWKDTNNPVNRIVKVAPHCCFAIGILPEGVGENLASYTDNPFQIRNNSGKIYPHPINSDAVGSPLEIGDTYTAVMYRALCDKPQVGTKRICAYDVPTKDGYYVFADFSDSVVDNIVLDDDFNGKAITVVQAVNTELKTTIYNGGFVVNATYVSGESCFIVVKIS